MKKWITNAFENEVANYTAAYVTEGRTVIVGDPKPTSVVNFQRMKKLKLVGLYEEVEVKLENIRVEPVNESFRIIFEFTNYTEVIWFYKGMSTKSVIQQIGGFLQRLITDLV